MSSTGVEAGDVTEVVLGQVLGGGSGQNPARQAATRLVPIKMRCERSTRRPEFKSLKLMIEVKFEFVSLDEKLKSL